MTALAAGDAAAGIALLDELEDRGRDLRVFLDQVVDAIRDRLLAGLTSATADEGALIAAAHRLGAIDPTRLGPGGLRLQLELALLDPTAGGRIAAQPRAAAPPRSTRPHAGHGRTAGRVARGRERRSRGQPKPPSPRPRRPRRSPRPAEPPAEAPAAEAPAHRPRPRPRPKHRPRPKPRPRPRPPRSPSQAAPGGDLERLRRGWSEVVATVSKSPPLKPLIESCRPIGVEGTIVTLGFPEEKDFLREAAERKRAGIEAGIAAYLGHPVGVRCVVSNLDLLPPLPDDGDAAHILAEAQRIFAEDIADVREVT